MTFGRYSRVFTPLLPMALTGCIFVHGGSAERPVSTNDAVTVPNETSSFSVPITVDTAALTRQANASIPRRLADQDWTNVDACVAAQYERVCTGPIVNGTCYGLWVTVQTVPQIDCRFAATVDRGEIAVSAQNDALTGRMPIRIEGKVRGRGEIGRHIQLEPRGSLNADFTAAVDLSPDYEPLVRTDIDYSWRTFMSIYVLGIRIRVDELANEEIDRKIDDLTDDIAESIGQIDFRSDVERGWASMFRTVDLGDRDYLRLTPMRVAFARPQAVDGDLRLNLGAEFAVQAFSGTSQPDDHAPRPLPPLEREVRSDGFAFHVPLTIGFERMLDELNAGIVFNQWMPFDIDGIGRGRAKILDTEMYQTTDNRLVIGVRLQADLPGRILDARGWLWTTTDFAIDTDRRSIQVQGLRFASNTDNWVVNTLVKIANVESIRTRIERSATFDFSEDYQETRMQLEQELNREIAPGLTMHGNISEFDFDWLGASPSGAVIGVSVAGDLEVAAGD